MTDNANGDILNSWEKFFAGSLLITFTVLAMTAIIGYWPDRLPLPKESIKPLYIKQFWHVRLACIKDTCCCVDSALVEKDSVQVIDSVKIAGDTTGAVKQVVKKTVRFVRVPINRLIDLNVLTLFLVGLGGFLGNMIHIGTSFTTFVGSRSFKRQWYLWYFVKPFTAAALAMGLYFVFRAGFLNYSADPAGINLYGVMTVAILAGLFTDRATLKLGEVFEVVFSVKKDGKSNDNRPDPLVPPPSRFDKPPSPDKLARGIANLITITGDNLDKGKMIFTMNGVALPDGSVSRALAKITLNYTVPADPEVKKVSLLITDDKKKELYSFDFVVI